MRPIRATPKAVGAAASRWRSGAVLFGVVVVAAAVIFTPLFLHARSPRASTWGHQSLPPWPTVNTTGWAHTGVRLSPYTGPFVITQSGTKIDAKDVQGCLSIMADDVTITRSRIACAGQSRNAPGTMVVQQGTTYSAQTSGLVMTDDEIVRPPGHNGSADYGLLVYGTDVTLTRVSVHNVTSGVKIAGNRVSIQDSYIWGLVNISGQDHNDGVIANGGTSNVLLQNNSIEVPLGQTTPLAIFPETAPNSYWTVEHNLLNGGSYCIYPSYTKPHERPNHHIVVKKNVFGTKFFDGCGSAGPVDEGRGGARFQDGEGNIWDENTWTSGGLPVPAEGGPSRELASSTGADRG